MPKRRVPISGHDREYRGRTLSVRPYTQLRNVLGETVPGFASLKRKTNTQLGFLANSLAPAGWGLGDVIDASQIKVGDVAVLNTYGQRRVIVVEAIEPRSEHDSDMTVSGPLIASSNPFDNRVIQDHDGVWGYVEQVDYGVRPSGRYDPLSFRDPPSGLSDRIAHAYDEALLDAQRQDLGQLEGDQLIAFMGDRLPGVPTSQITQWLDAHGKTPGGN